MTSHSQGPLVSILTPAYNAESWIGATIESGLRQTHADVELIVVDDGSTDDTLAVAKSYRDPRLHVISQPNQGPCSAYNTALKNAQGDYIQYLDADDLLDPRKIEVQLERLREEPDGTIASSAWSRFYEDDIGSADFSPGPDWRDYEPATDWLIQSWEGRGTIPNFAWLTPRALSDAAGLWNEKVRVGLDGEYFARVLVHAHKIAFCSEARGYYRSGLPTSSSKARVHGKLDALYETTVLCEHTLLEHRDTPEARRAVAGLYQRFLFTAYPDVPDLVRRAEVRVEELGGMYRKPGVSRPFRPVRDYIGWKTALRLQRLYDRLRYGAT